MDLDGGSDVLPCDLGWDGGVRTDVIVDELTQDAPAYPMLTSARADKLIGSGARVR